MRVNELAAVIGQTGFLVDAARGFRYRVRVLDARSVYGRVQYEVTTLDDTTARCRAWVDEQSIHQLNEG